MSQHKSIIGLQLLEDQETRLLLKRLILKKEARYKDIKRQRKLYIVASTDYSHLSSDFRPYFLEKVFDVVREGSELRGIERDLSNMCFALTKKEPELGPKISKEWEKAYHHATQEVQIADVISHLLGLDNLKRNIACPFHEDKSPSLKVYIKSNRFVCFGCSTKGSPIDFVMQFQSCSFKEAVQYLSNSSL